MSPEFWIHKLSVHMGRIPWHPIPRDCEILLVLQLFWWVLWGTYKSIAGWHQRIVGLTMAESSPGSCPASAWKASVIRKWLISDGFQPILGVTLNVRENSYVVPTWCSQPFLLIGSNSTSMKLPTSRSGCLLPHSPAAFWYFLTSLLRLPFTTKPHNCFHP